MLIKSICVLFVGLVTIALSSVTSNAGRVVIDPPAGANWADHAEKYLTNYRENRPFDRRKDIKTLRCVKMNNYGCLWQTKGNWEGTPGPDGTNGAHDGEGGNSGHAIFLHPKWSIVASLRWFERKASYNQSKRSALYLAERYAPWCDTIGSKGTKVDPKTGTVWGRGCVGGKQPPKGFKGPRCGKPASGKPSAAQCRVCNCPNSIAAFWLKGTSSGINDGLELFDADGKPTQTMLSIISWKVGLETGRYKPNQLVLDEALGLFEPK